MKIFRFLVAALALLLSSSCEKQIDGGYIHVHIFIYTGEGKELKMHTGIVIPFRRREGISVSAL